MSLFAAGVWFWKGYRTYGKRGYELSSAKWNPHEFEVDISAVTFMITGANSGLGKETALALAKLGGNVHMVCRNKERGELAQQEIITKTNNANVHLHIVDLSSLAEIKRFSSEIIEQDIPLNVLVNNAGVLLNDRSKTSEGFEMTFATNLLGTYALTESLMPVLVKHASKDSPARVVTVSSGGMYVSVLANVPVFFAKEVLHRRLTSTKNVKLDNDNLQAEKQKKFDGTLAYAQTKRAQVCLSELWAKRYSPVYPINFYAMHPGWAITPGVETSIPGFFNKMQNMMRTSEQGADTIVYLCISQSTPSPKEETGLFYFDREAVNTHIWGAGTQSTEDSYQTLWKSLTSILPAFEDGAPLKE